MPLKRIEAAGFAALALLALMVSLYLTHVRHRLQLQPGWHSACAISDSMSCDTVLMSPYASIAGTPISALGAWYYSVAAIIATAALFKLGFPRSSALVLFAASGLASTVSLVLIVLSARIGSFCPLCALLHVINFAMFFLSWRSLRVSGEAIAETFASERRWWDKHLTQATLFATAALFALLVVFVRFSRDAVTPSRFCRAIEKLDAANAATSPVELVVYLDFQCPHCAALNRALRAVRNNPRIRIIPRRHPRERECNPSVRQVGREGSCLQARAAICADGHDRNEEFSDSLFDGGQKDERGLVALAASLGLDPVAFRSCLGSDDTLRQLQAEMAAAKTDQVSVVPTVVVGGLKHEGTLTEGELACLARVGTRPGASSDAAAPRH